MDHAYVEEHGLIERYHRGLLEPEEETRFEEHYFSCPQCMEQLELARGFQRGLQAATAEDAARAVVGAGLFAWLARRGRLAQLGLTLAVLLAAALPALWLLGENRGLRQARQEQTEQQRQTEAARRDAEARLAASERQRQEERRDLEQRLAQAQRPSGPAAPEASRPLVPTVLLLTTLRDEPGEPAATFPSGSPVTLAVDAGSDPGFASYRVTVTGAGGRTLFRQDGLRPNALEVLMVTFPAGFFAPGDYRLTVEGLRSGGEAAGLGGSPFRVVP